jgi:hypothetical protein
LSVKLNEYCIILTTSDKRTIMIALDSQNAQATSLKSRI